MNESKTGLFRSFWYSITSFSKYRLFLRQSTGRVVVYLLLLSVVSTLGSCIGLYAQTSEVTDRISRELIDGFPDFRLENGQLEIYAEMPIVIEDDPPVVIDTRPSIDVENILYQYDNVILITRDRYIRKSYLQRQELQWNLVYNNVTITRDNIRETIPYLKTILVIIFAVIAVISYVFITAGNFINALIVSAIGAIVNVARGTRLSYRNVFKISVYSMTLPMTVGAVMDILRIRIPFGFVFFLAGCSIYIIGAISMIKAGFDSMYGDPGNFSSFGGFRDPGGHGDHSDYGSSGGYGDIGTPGNNFPGSGHSDARESDSGQTGPDTGDTGSGDPAGQADPS